MSKSKKTTRRVCEKCEKSKVLSDFYNADKDFFPSGKLHLCTDCAIEIAESKGHEGFLGLLRMINKPFYQELYKDDMRQYIRIINSMPQYRNVNFLDSDTLAELTSLDTIKRTKPTELSEEDMRDSEDFWSRGYTEEEYIYLNSEYGDFLARYEVDSKTMENLIREICLVQLDIRRARSNGKDVKNELKAYNDLLTAANLKPSQETGNQSVEQETFGTLIKKWEDTRPIQDDSEWRKHDSIGKYIKTWFTGHLMRMFDIENEDESEYYEELNKYTVSLEEEGEDNGRDN